MMTKTTKPLASIQLFTRCDIEQFHFDSTHELPDVEIMPGQERATDAVKFGIGIQQKGYNLFLMGPPGSGKHTLIDQFLQQQAAASSPPNDWCYAYNFDQPHKPNAIELPPGQGPVLKREMEQLIDELQSAISTAFESDEYQARVESLEVQLKSRQQDALAAISEAANSKNIRLLRTSDGFVFAPTKDDEILEPEDFNKLPESEQQDIQQTIHTLQDRLRKVLESIPRWSKETHEKIKELNRETARLAIHQPIAELMQHYQDFPEVTQHLERIQQDILENVHNFRKREEGGLSNLFGRNERRQDILARYKVNALVDHSDADRAPVIYEDQPSYQNLVGRVEHLSQMGTLITDFTLIKPGALHQANGGYLVLDADKVLTQPYAWEGLKRALRSEELHIDSLGQLLSLISTVSLEPEPIPLQVKIVLLGSRRLFHLLNTFDPEFSELFKVAADFEDEVARDADNNLKVAHFIATQCRKQQLLPLSRAAVGRVIEYCSRLVDDAERLSTHLRSLCDLLSETNHWAKQNSHPMIEPADVEQALAHQEQRNNRLAQRLQDDILRDTIRIDTEGAKVGQINGLSVITLSNHRFAQPTRITATIRVGDGHVTDIEREVELGGPIHSKGVLILSSYLAERYSKNRPLSFHASIVFEQSYGEVEGDSASLAELCALLSAVAELPINQSLAVTGSVNQRGDVQAIGGVNEKIEGFFDICSKRGLTGHQGVLIPADNVKHLMLHQRVIEAVEKGQFQIYPVRHLDEASNLLLGLPAGERDLDGLFPTGTLNAVVEEKLAEYAVIKHSFGEAFKGENN